MTFSEALVQVVLDRVHRGIKETSRNRGPEVDRYHLRVGLDPAKRYPWCCSGLYDAAVEAAAIAGCFNPFPRTAKAVQVFARAPREVLRSNPRAGYVYVLDHGKPGDVLAAWRNNRYTDAGHIGVVTLVNDAGDVAAEASANTNASGSREGDRWAVHLGRPEVSHGGVLLPFIDMDAWEQVIAEQA